MNYKQHYDNLINRATCKKLPGTEQHHIIPVCMGGTDDDSNIVALTPEEHFIAHKLLAKIYPDHIGVITAYYKMCLGEYIETGVTNKMCRTRRDLEKHFASLPKYKEAYKKWEFEKFKVENKIIGTKATTREIRQAVPSLLDVLNIPRKEIIEFIQNEYIAVYRWKSMDKNSTNYKSIITASKIRAIGLENKRAEHKGWIKRIDKDAYRDTLDKVDNSNIIDSYIQDIFNEHSLFKELFKVEQWNKSLSMLRKDLNKEIQGLLEKAHKGKKFTLRDIQTSLTTFKGIRMGKNYYEFFIRGTGTT